MSDIIKTIAEIQPGSHSHHRRRAVTEWGTFFIDDSCHPEVTAGQYAVVQFDEQDQFASIIVPPYKVAPEGLWSDEHGKCYGVPAALVEAGLNDTSWHNDMCPSFALPEDKDCHCRLWSDHWVPELRECGGKQFTVYYSKEAGCGDHDKDLDTDDVQEAIATLKRFWEEHKASLQASTPTPPASAPELKGPRFVLLIGAIHEQYPDVPNPEGPLVADGAVVCWDRQEHKAVFTLHKEYAQLVCLELAGQAGPEGMCRWINHTPDEALTSENIPADTRAWDEGEE